MPMMNQAFNPSQIAPEAIDFLGQIEAEKASNAALAARQAVADELLSHCSNWLENAKTWRAQDFEDDWEEWRRNADGVFDPTLAAKKRDWQSRAFVDLTASHRETIHATLYKLIAGARPPLEVVARPSGTQNEGDSVRDLVVRELEKSQFMLELDKILDDADTYGSGFCRLRWENRIEPRLIRQAVPEPLDPYNGSIQRHLSGQPFIAGFQEVLADQLIYRGTRIEHIPIYDFFPDPKALEIKGNPCAYRYWLTLGEIKKGVDAGYYLPEAYTALEDAASDETDSSEKTFVESSRALSQTDTPRTKYAKRYECYEKFARLPAKWIFPFIGHGEPQDPEQLIPARIIFHKKTLVGVELNSAYDGEADFYRLDYQRVNGRFYGRGIPEMLRHAQKIINEIVNQRLDEGNLALNQRYAVIEKALVDPERDLEDPFAMVRIRKEAMPPSGDVRAVVLPLDRPDVKRNAGFSEVYEWERMAQERTSANRATLGTVGQVNDSNQTLGGQQLLEAQTGKKLAYIGIVQEFAFLTVIFDAYWKLIYQNIQPNDLLEVLGPDRALTFQLPTPEQVNRAYRFTPQGIFEMENKAMRQARLQAIFQQFAPFPWINPMKFFDQLTKDAGLDPMSLKYSPEEMQQMIVAQGLMATAQNAQIPGNQGMQNAPGNAGGASQEATQ